MAEAAVPVLVAMIGAGATIQATKMGIDHQNTVRAEERAYQEARELAAKQGSSNRIGRPTTSFASSD